MARMSRTLSRPVCPPPVGSQSTLQVGSSIGPIRCRARSNGPTWTDQTSKILPPVWVTHRGLPWTFNPLLRSPPPRRGAPLRCHFHFLASARFCFVDEVARLRSSRKREMPKSHVGLNLRVLHHRHTPLRCRASDGRWTLSWSGFRGAFVLRITEPPTAPIGWPMVPCRGCSSVGRAPAF